MRPMALITHITHHTHSIYSPTHTLKHTHMCNQVFPRKSFHYLEQKKHLVSFSKVSGTIRVYFFFHFDLGCLKFLFYLFYKMCANFEFSYLNTTIRRCFIVPQLSSFLQGTRWLGPPHRAKHVDVQQLSRCVLYSSRKIIYFLLSIMVKLFVMFVLFFSVFMFLSFCLICPM